VKRTGHETEAVNKPPLQCRWGGALRDGAVLLFAYANYASYSFVCRQRVLGGQWPDWTSSAIVLAAVSGRSAAGRPGPRESQMFSHREKLHPREVYASGGGLLVVPISSIIAPHLLVWSLTSTNR